MNTRIETLSREEYLLSIDTIADPGSRRFADQALAWWDRHFSWKATGCNVLIDQEGTHLCYLFSKTDRYGEYLTIYNLLTPLIQRRKGYAHELLRLSIALALKNHVRRINFSSVSASLDFYISLGFIYWGINDIGDYYCDLPIPSNGLDGMEKMTRTTEIQLLAGKKLDKICQKVQGNEENLTAEQSIRLADDQAKLAEKWKGDALAELKESLS